MHAGRLSLFLLITLMLPTRQVVMPQRDPNAEENVATNFLRLRQHAKLNPVKRVEGSAFSAAACGAAFHGQSDKVWVEGANYAATIYSTAHPEDAQPITGMAVRPWNAEDRLITGVCFANTPAFPSGRYWVAIGVVGNTSEKSVAELLGAGPQIHNNE